MSKRDPKTAIPGVPELPEEVRGAIRGEIDSSLSNFREGDFEGKLRTAMRAEARGDGRDSARSVQVHRPRRSALRRWAPVCAVALIALAILIAVPSKINITKSKPDPMAAALGRLPGIQSMERAASEPAATPEAALAESPLIGPLAALAASSSSAAASASVPTPSAFVPRYTLERKIEILTEERPIERALVLIKSKFGEV
jgi:hypothetical protein